MRTRSSIGIRYATLVGADGASSTLRRFVDGRKPRVSPALQACIAPMREEVINDQKPSDQGVCWYIPRGEDAVIGSLFHQGGAAHCRMRLAQFCEKLGIGMPPLRGAPIPTGDDVRLQAGEHVYFAGDAAGLIDPYTGAGIHYALESAKALAQSLLGGTPYERAMATTVAHVAQEAAATESANLRACLRIAFAARGD